MSLIREVFYRLDMANFTVNLLKNEFAKAEVECLGYIVGGGKVKPIDVKVESFVTFPEPRSKKKLSRFLGMSGYYRRFCENFSSVAFPLTHCLKGRSLFGM